MHKKLLRELITAPDTQLAGYMRMKIAILLVDGYTKQDIDDILDECVYNSLASSLVIKVLEIVSNDLK